MNKHKPSLDNMIAIIDNSRNKFQCLLSIVVIINFLCIILLYKSNNIISILLAIPLVFFLFWLLFTTVEPLKYLPGYKDKMDELINVIELSDIPVMLSKNSLLFAFETSYQRYYPIILEKLLKGERDSLEGTEASGSSSIELSIPSMSALFDTSYKYSFMEDNFRLKMADYLCTLINNTGQEPEFLLLKTWFALKPKSDIQKEIRIRIGVALELLNNRLHGS